MKLSLFCLVIFIALPVFAQEGDVTRPEDLEQRVHVLGSPSQNPQDSQANPEAVAAPTDTPLNEDDQLLNDLEEQKRQQAETAVKLEQAKNTITEVAFNAPEELKKLGHEQITAASLMDEKVVAVIKKMMAQSTLKNSTDDEVKQLIMEKAKGSFMEKFLTNNPKVLMMFTEIVKDEKAMSSMVGIFLRKSDLKIYGCIWLCFMILSWLIKKYAFKKDWSSGKRFVMSLALSLAITGTTLTIFYNMFYEEISPVTKIIVKHWRKRNLKT